MAIGKLTARLEKDNKKLPSPDSARMARLEKDNKKLPSPDSARMAGLEKDKKKLPSPAFGRASRAGGGLNQSDSVQSAAPLFAVRTPTATVTDLGTEFGVEVDAQGRTESHVFVGAVRVQRMAANGQPESSQILHAGQTAHCTKEEGTRVSEQAVPPGRFVRRIEPNVTKTTRVVESFAGGKMTAFEQSPPGCYLLKTDGATYLQPKGWSPDRQSRGYVRTLATDFCDRDFVFEATVDVRILVPAEHIHYVFFGIGDGVPNHDYCDEVNTGFSLSYLVDTGWVFVRHCQPGANRNLNVADMIAANVLEPGRHRLRMAKEGGRVRFFLDADYNGKFHADFSSQWFDLHRSAPSLNAANSRLFIGTGNCNTVTVRIEELSVSYTGDCAENGSGPMSKKPCSNDDTKCRKP